MQHCNFLQNLTHPANQRNKREIRIRWNASAKVDQSKNLPTTHSTTTNRKLRSSAIKRQINSVYDTGMRNIKDALTHLLVQDLFRSVVFTFFFSSDFSSFIQCLRAISCSVYHSFTKVSSLNCLSCSPFFFWLFLIHSMSSCDQLISLQFLHWSVSSLCESVLCLLHSAFHWFYFTIARFTVLCSVPNAALRSADGSWFRNVLLVLTCWLFGIQSKY